VKRGAVPVLLVLAMAGSARANEPTDTRDLRSEIAWARATWPDELKGLHFQGPLSKLLAWAPRRGSAVVYLYTHDFACRQATLAPAERTEDDGAGELPPQTLTARINHRPRIEDGELVREVTFVEVGARLSREDGVWSTEARDAAGHWQPHEGGGGFMDPIVYGALSYADDRVARWDGEGVEIDSYCAGPVEWLACPDGGERPCERCEQVSILVAEPGASWGHGHDYGGRRVTCNAACPSYPQSPDLVRLDRLRERVAIWRPRRARPARVPSLYKSLDECLREHPELKRQASPHPPARPDRPAR